MENQTKALLLRIFISSTDQYEHKNVYESIVLQAKEKGLAGATVFKGILGYGASSVIHSYKFWEAAEKLPTVVEIIDEEEKINGFYESIRPMLESMRFGCLATTEPVRVLLRKAGEKRKFS